MRWFFRDEDLAQGGDFGNALRALFAAMRPHLEYCDMRCIWIVRRRKTVP